MQTRSLTNSISYQKIALLKFPRVSFKIFWLLTALLIISLLVFYIFQVNTIVSGRYLIQEYENRLIKLSKENKNLEVNSVQAISLDNIIGLLEDSGFEKTNKVHYIRILENKVVTK